MESQQKAAKPKAATHAKKMTWEEFGAMIEAEWEKKLEALPEATRPPMRDVMGRFIAFYITIASHSTTPETVPPEVGEQAKALLLGRD